jgi:phospholipid/cholesterol/gamma-HCH transport system substrate-binding protein
MSAIESRRVAGPLIKLIIFAAITVMVTGMLAQTLGSLSFASGTAYRARFSDVTGVLAGDDVRIAGVRVGQVTRVSLVDNTTAELELSVDRAIPIPASVHATIRYRNLVGQRYVALAEGPGGGPGGGASLPAGGLIPLSQTTPALDLTVLFNGFQPLFSALSPDDVNSLSYEIIQVLQGEGGTVAGLLQHTASLASTLGDRDAVIARVITNLNDVLSTLESHREELSQTIAQLDLFVSGLAADRTAIGSAISNINELTSATGSLLTEVRPDLATDVAGLGDLAGTLSANGDVIDQTLTDLPGRYQALTRTASDGSWFNFFTCGFDGRVALPGGPSVNPATFSSQAAKCQGGGR